MGVKDTVNKGLTIRPARKEQIKAERKELHKEPRFPEQRLIADIPTKLHKRIKILGMGLYKLEEPKEKGGEPQVRTVPLKDIVIEALEDVLKKYEEGNGKFDTIE